MLFLLLLMLPGSAFSAADPSPENARCMACHGDKKITSKDSQHLFIDSGQYAATTHSYIGCTSCHTTISPQHPKETSKPAVPARATCGECHEPIQTEYSKSMHGTRAACTDCHNPHEVKSPTAISGKQINAKCAKCHDTANIVKSHTKWLPQADLHIDSLPCITCHTGSKNYVITLFIQKRKAGATKGEFNLATFDDLSHLLPEGSDLGRLIDKSNNGFISLKDLRAFNSQIRNNDGAYNSQIHNNEMRLWGMMTPEVVSHKYEILENRWDCSFCHASGPKAMQKSYVAFPDKSGGFTRLAVEKGAILDILNGTPDFYMLGATRSMFLNIIGALIIAGGLVMPIGHGTLRFLTRKNRKKPTP